MHPRAPLPVRAPLTIRAPLAEARIRSPYRLPSAEPPALAWHVTFRLHDDVPIASCAAHRRLAAATLLEVGRDHELLAFAIADTHGHAVAACDRPSAGLLARRIEVSLGWRLGLTRRFEPARIRPIATPSHLRRALLYVLRQASHHAPGLDPFHDGSALVDLLGLRVIGSDLAPRVFTYLPRLARSDLAAELGPALDEPGEVAFDLLPAAAAAAFALPALTGRSVLESRARRAAIHAAPDLASRDLADLLGVSRSSVQHLRLAPVDEADSGAVRLQLRMRSWLAVREATAPV